MTQHEFLRGMSFGLMAGAAIGMAMAPKKKINMKNTAGKALKTVGAVMEHISDTMGM